MFHSKISFATKIIAPVLTLLVGQPSFAQDDSSIKGNVNLSTWTVSYISWTEYVDLTDGVLTDETHANIYGNALTYEAEFYRGYRYGWAYEVGFLSGQANAGGTQPLLTYQSANQKWFGAEIATRVAYRLTPQITMSIGPMGLYRNLKFPSEGGVDAKSGASFNFVMLGDLRMRLNRNWELRQQIGSMSFRASTYWSFGLGYKY